MRGPLNRIIRNAVFANVLMLMIVFSGLIAMHTMVRELFPRFSLDRVSVQVPYPGADPSEVEEGICLKLEEALEGIENVRKVTATAVEGMGTAVVECTQGADVQEVKDEVETQVATITTFPDDAERPIVRELKMRNDVLGIAVWGDLPEYQLRDLAERIKDDLLTIRGISQVSVTGTRDYEISIEISEARLRQYGLTFSDVSAAVARSSLNLPGGTIRTRDEELRLRAQGRRYRAVDFADIPVVTRADGTVVRLGQLADARDAFDEDAEISADFNGHHAISVDIYKTENEDSIRISELVDEYLQRKRTELPPSVHLTKWRDNSRLITDRLNMLVRNGKIGLALVLLSLWLFLDVRLSFWVAMGIPISLAGGLGLMAAYGETINMLSLFGLIMVLGLIVDDAIVVGESIYVHRRSGLGPVESAVSGTLEVAWPVLAAVLTTILAFLPLFFVSGVMGKFIQHIPVPVVAALTISLLEALLILPVHLRHLPDMTAAPRTGPLGFARRMRQRIANGLEWFTHRIYGRAMVALLRLRYAVLAAAVALMLITVGLVEGGVLKYVLFPETDSDFLVATVELPAGTPAASTRATAREAVAAWQRLDAHTETASGKPLTVAVFTLIGASMTEMDGTGGSNTFQIIVELLPSEDRGLYHRDLSRQWQQETGPIPGATKAEFGATRAGPGGRPLEVMLLGADQTELLAASRELADKLARIDGVYDVQSDYRPGKREFRVGLKPTAEPLGLKLADVARQLRQGYYGDEVMRVQRGRDEVKVKIRYPLVGGRDSLALFRELRVRTAQGAEVPLLSVATLREVESPTTIRRQQRKRTISISSDLDRAVANAQEITLELERDFLPGLLKRFPGVTYSTEGQAQETRESLSSLKIGFPLAMIGVYLILATIFHSYVQPLIIMITIPFGLIGAAGGHLLFGRNLTMLSLFGMVALTGIVVNDAIVLIEAVNSRLAGGMPLFQALREGGQRRFRAIFLTTLTTFAGLMPIIVEKSMQAQFLIPMAISIAFGVAFATVITLVVVPCLLAAVNDIRRIGSFALTGRWPSREQVEPGASR